MTEEGVLERSLVYVIACTYNHSEKRDQYSMIRKQSILPPWPFLERPPCRQELVPASQ
jgi:hypothetical protein